MFDSYNIKEIRCLPMDSQYEFINEDEVREIFNTGLAEYGEIPTLSNIIIKQMF